MNPESNVCIDDKYEYIESITVIGWKFKKPSGDVLLPLPRTSSEVLELLKSLPPGFITDYEYGLGLLNRYRFIIESLEKIPHTDLEEILYDEDSEETPRIKHLVISCRNETGIDGNIYTLGINDFLSIVHKMKRVCRNHQDASRKERRKIAYDFLASSIDPWHYSYPPSAEKDAISKLVLETDFTSSPLSSSDSETLINLVSGNAETLYSSQRKEVAKLGEDINLLNLEWLIDQMEALLSKPKSNEAEWQKLINENPFMISIVFGYPIIKIQDQASIGGRGLSGAGDKITDFLVRNNLTNNTALVEIKTPGTILLNQREYRGGVYSPSSDLCGSVNQLLDQKYLFQREINSLKANSREFNMESYSVECILIIGRVPEEVEKKKSFELFRHNSKDVKIFTFDELLHKLKEICSFLKKEGENSDSDLPF